MTDVDRLTLDFATQFPGTFAQALGQASPGDSSRVIGRLPDAVCAAVVAHLPAAHVRSIVGSGDHTPSDWLEHARFDDAVSMLNRLPHRQRATFIKDVGNRWRRERLLRHQQFPPHTIGAIVSDLPLRIEAERPASEVLAELRELGGNDPGGLVVVDVNGRYVGLVNRWLLMLAQPASGAIRQYLIETTPIYPETAIASVAQRNDWHRRNWLAVVDHKQRVLGGVSREAVFLAAAELGGAKGSGDVMLDLLRDATHLLARLLESFFPPGRVP